MHPADYAFRTFSSAMRAAISRKLPGLQLFAQIVNEFLPAQYGSEIDLVPECGPIAQKTQEDGHAPGRERAHSE